MLRRIEGFGAWGLRGMDWGGAAALGRRAIRWVALAGATFLLCRLDAARGLAPFALAFISAALLSGHDAAALLVGCLAGAINGPIGDFNLRLPIGVAIALGGSIAWDMLAPALDGARWQRLIDGFARLGRRPAPRMQARSPNGRDAILCSALAGAGVLLPGLWGMGEAVWAEAAAVVAASVAAVAAAPFLRAALDGGLNRCGTNPETRIGIFLMGGLLVAGLARLSPPVALCVGGALIQLQCPAGALVGAGVGAALLASGVEMTVLALAVCMGATAQLCASLSRPARSTCACLAALAAGLVLGASPGMLVAAGVASALAAVAPRRWAEALARLARPARGACDPARLAARMQRQSAARLRALGAAFGELAEGYAAPGTLPDELALTRRLRDRLCAGCAGYGACWDGGSAGGARLLCDLIARAVALSGEAPLFEGEAPPELTRRCRRGRLIPERLQEELEDFARQRRAALRRGEENRLISAQFDQARRMLLELADRQARPLAPRARRARLRADAGVLCASRVAGSPCGDSHLVCMLDDERLLAVISDGMGSGDDAARESAVAVRLLGRFLKAGAPAGLALETVNALMLNRVGDDMFATVDLMVLNLTTGEARFSKLAACPTLIVRGGAARWIEGGRLPLGILERVSPGVAEARLLPGDALLMVSDGVMDAAGGAALEELLLEGEADSRTVARRAVALAEAACDGQRRDDMTAMCLRIERR